VSQRSPVTARVARDHHDTRLEHGRREADTAVRDRPAMQPAPTTTAPSVRTLIDEFLADQAATTAVERFARHHDAGPDPAQARYYRDLLPATPPGPGQQYGFEVDLDACSGCKACVVACGSLNGLPDGVSFRSVGTVVGGTDRDLPVLRNVTTACHHCVEPGCLAGCPVDAYEKDPVTGVVRHLDDQCIGCSYCTLTCPYEVPAFDADRGIVRKCDLCHDRLAVGEAPACVQACPTEAIRVRIVDLETAVEDVQHPWAVPAPSPALTVPTTRYRTSEDLGGDVAAVDREALSPGHAHPPLTVMLVLTQVAVGALVALVTARWWSYPGVQPAATSLAAVALLTGVVAMGASVLHLGRPLLAWRAVIGLRHSWLSREIVAFGLFAPATAVYATGLAGWAPVADHTRWLGPLAATIGLGAVGTSVMVYAVTGRRWWSTPRVAARFGFTTLLGGTSALVAVSVVTAAVAGSDDTATNALAATLRGCATLASLLTASGVAAELLLLRHRRDRGADELGRTARLLAGPSRRLVTIRLGLLVAGGALAPWLVVRMLTVEPTSPTAAAVTALLGFLMVAAAELLERWRFFTASAPARMPGRLP
jgi:formate dehydrogenase iron-sulfur subunit